MTAKMLELVYTTVTMMKMLVSDVKLNVGVSLVQFHCVMQSISEKRLLLTS